MKRSRQIFFYGLPLVLAGLMVGLMIWKKFDSGAIRAGELPRYGQLPNFELTNQDNLAFSNLELKDRINVINFMFTTCQGICPSLSKEMEKLHSSFSRYNAVTLLSISVDPANDTPEQLKSWTQEKNIDTERWNFLTGPRPQVKTLLEEGLKIGLPDQLQAHSDRFVLVDRHNEIRGYYSLSAPETLEHLKDDIFRLL
jgi:protein SCO1/2